MRKPLMPLVLLLSVMGGGWLLRHYEIRGLDQIQFFPREGTSAASWTSGEPPAAGAPGDTIRVASFNIQVFGEEKLAKPRVMEVLAAVVRQFDVVAVQEVRAKGQDVVPRFVALINSQGASYDFVLGPRLGRSTSKEQYAFIFNQARLETDRDAVYTIEDPDDLMHREPLAAPFRVRGLPVDQAFTFTLVNVHTDPDEVRGELNVLDDVYRAVLADGRREDDVILIGDFNADEQYLSRLGQAAGLQWAVTGVPTNTRGTRMLDNLLFDPRATVEFQGRSGVVDLVREFNLTVDEALAVSDHLPIWAEFSPTEGAAGGRVASRPR